MLRDLCFPFFGVASRRGIFGTVGMQGCLLQRQVNHMTCLQISNGPFRQSLFLETIQVGGWSNPSEKYMSNWKSSQTRGENKRYLELPPPFESFGPSTNITARRHTWSCLVSMYSALDPKRQYNQRLQVNPQVTNHRNHKLDQGGNRHSKNSPTQITSSEVTRGETLGQCFFSLLFV